MFAFHRELVEYCRYMGKPGAQGMEPEIEMDDQRLVESSSIFLEPLWLQLLIFVRQPKLMAATVLVGASRISSIGGKGYQNHKALENGCRPVISASEKLLL